MVALSIPANEVGTHRQPFEVVDTELVAPGEEAIAGLLPGTVQVELACPGNTDRHTVH